MQLKKFAAVVLVVAAIGLAVTAGCAVAATAAPADAAPQTPCVPYHHHAYASCPYSGGQCPADNGGERMQCADFSPRHHNRC